jgi:hypothetical protein
VQIASTMTYLLEIRAHFGHCSGHSAFLDSAHNMLSGREWDPQTSLYASPSLIA